MKYEKTAEDVQVEQSDMRSNRTLQHLRDINFYKFSVGDVLIREDKYGEQWKVKMAACGLPYKYVYAFENELGVGYIRRLSVNGKKFVEAPTCVVHFEPQNTRFVLDPAFANHILLAPEGEELDVKSEYSDIKKQREAMHRKNKKIALKLDTDADVLDFMKTLKPGDQFWSGWSIRSIRKDPNIVSKVYFEPGALNLDRHFVECVASGLYSYNTKFNAYNLKNHLIFLQKPLFMDDVL